MSWWLTFLAVALALAPFPSSPQIRLKHLELSMYPPLARQAALQGTVEVGLLIAPDGTVSSMTTSGSAPPLLQTATRSMLKNWSFACDGCAPGTTSAMTLLFTYRLVGKAANPDRTQWLIDLPAHFTIVAIPFEVETTRRSGGRR